MCVCERESVCEAERGGIAAMIDLEGYVILVVSTQEGNIRLFGGLSLFLFFSLYSINLRLMLLLLAVGRCDRL